MFQKRVTPSILLFGCSGREEHFLSVRPLLDQPFTDLAEFKEDEKERLTLEAMRRGSGSSHVEAAHAPPRRVPLHRAPGQCPRC